MIKDRIQRLIEAYTDDREILDLICSAVKACHKYIAAVVDSELVIMTAKHTLDPDDYRTAVSVADKKRTLVHNNLISEVGILNRLCVKAGVPVVFEGNIGNRVEVGELAKVLTYQLYDARRM